MKTIELLKELQEIDPKFSITLNINRPAGGSNAQGISNLRYEGVEICPLPSEEISDEPNHESRYHFPDGTSARHKCRQEVIGAAKDVLERLNNPAYREAFYDKN